MSHPPVFPDRVQALLSAVTEQDGESPRELRTAIADRAGALDDAGRDAIEIPAGLAPYVDKVSRHAYRVTDDDVTDLVASGYSEDQVFEITVAAAVGASRVRLERALVAIAEVFDAADDPG